MSTSQTLYHTTVASGAPLTTADLLSDTLGAPTGASKNITVGSNVNFVELAAQGNGAPTFFGTIQPPTDHGWLYNNTALEGQSFNGGIWTPKMRLQTAVNTGGQLNADLYYRLYKRSSGGVYTLIYSFLLAGQVITTAGTTYTFAGVNLSNVVAFVVGDKLYVDNWANITANTTTGGVTTLKFISTSVANTGVNTYQVQTADYQPSVTASGLYFFGDA